MDAILGSARSLEGILPQKRSLGAVATINSGREGKPNVLSAAAFRPQKYLTIPNHTELHRTTPNYTETRHASPVVILTMLKIS